MKWEHIIFAFLSHHCLLPLFGGGGDHNVSFMIFAQEDIDIGTDGSTIQPGGSAPNCEEVCSSKVSQVTSIFHEQISTLQENLSEALKAKDELAAANEANSNAVEELLQEVAKQAQECESALLKERSNLEISNLKIKEMEADLTIAQNDLSTAQMKIEEFKQQKIYINTKVIKADMLAATNKIKRKVSQLWKKYNAARIAAE